jgi:hypothetical protein
MMYDLDLAGMVTATGITILAAVYLWSKDPGRRRRAWQLLKLLLRRLLRQVGGEGVGGVAVQAVAGVVVPAGGGRVFVAGVVLYVAQGAPASRAKVIADWRRLCGES